MATTTLVGIFDSVSEAERARESLLKQGLPRNSVHITNNESLMSRSSTTRSGSASTDSGDEHRGFFARLFGLGDNDHETTEYSNAVKSGSALLTVTLQDPSDARRVESLMVAAGADRINERSMGQAATGSQQQLQGARAPARQGATANGETLKVMQEELQVGKRTVESGGVRVRQHVTERPVHEQIQLCEEHAIVERRPVDRVAAPGEIDALSMKDRDIEIRERAEQAVVGKTARVVEEVRIGKEVTGRTETIDDTVRRTDVDVEQLAAQRGTQQGQNTQRNSTPPR